MKFKSLNNTSEDNVMLFDSDSTHLHVYSCVINGLTVFKSNFIEASHVEAAERSSNTSTGRKIIISEGIACCSLKDDNR